MPSVILPHLWHLALAQLSLLLVFYISAFLLGSLTKNLGQALLAVALVFALLFCAFWVQTKIPGGSISLFTDFESNLQSALLFSVVVVAPVFVFARRRIWVTRIAVLLSLLASILALLLAPLIALRLCKPLAT